MWNDMGACESTWVWCIKHATFWKITMSFKDCIKLLATSMLQLYIVRYKLKYSGPCLILWVIIIWLHHILEIHLMPIIGLLICCCVVLNWSKCMGAPYIR
jgi:hypothetical protein